MTAVHQLLADNLHELVEWMENNFKNASVFLKAHLTSDTSGIG